MPPLPQSPPNEVGKTTKGSGLFAETFMKINLVVSREYDQNAYCCFDPEAKEGVIIDPGLNCDGIVSFLNAEQINVKAILLTHGHYDHILSARRISDYTKADLCAHRMEVPVLEDPAVNLSIMRDVEKMSLHMDKLLEDGDEIHFGKEVFRVIHTPGHTPGGVCYYNEREKTIFTGDTMFWESIGRADLPLSDGQELTRSIKEKLLILPGDTTVYPGHGRPTDINHETMIHRRIE